MANDVIAQRPAQPQHGSWIGQIPFVGKMIEPK